MATEPMYFDVFWETLWSMTVWPLDTDIRFHAMALFGGYNLPLSTVAATAGATAGSLVNFFSGWLLAWFQKEGLSVLSAGKYSLWQKRALWLMPVVGLFSWFQLVAVLVMAAGFLRVKPWLAFLSLLVGQVAYYGLHYVSYTTNAV